jgi:hypothetical protein
MYANADVCRPHELTGPPDHHVLFDDELLCEVLAGAGFADIEDRSDREAEAHTEGWAPVVSQISLIFQARKPGLDAVR